MPYEIEDNNNIFYDIETTEVKLISDYTGLNFYECLSLDCYTYRLLFRDAYIYKMSQTEQGRAYLEECYYLTQTKPDVNSLRQQFGGG